ncbi:Neu5Ac permease [Hartmannibacter diazotrophicus]|uniref:TRAP transporter small permease protein n=1 Tax=Hartmannibacter diazotrophicus TaxID=1482074 RepID=A0A2C9DBW9_9HYPH|nr:TRAP transporter small permease [Hartmannibacter diazotrophicus]SON57797.1 Neu5Ac permease [Hartmannibacter diazotrophicus]
MLRMLDRLEEILIATLIALATVIIFVSVAHRYSLGFVAGLIGFGRSHDMMWLADGAKATYLSLRQINLVWAQELCIIFFVWMAKFGAAYGVRTGIHVGIDVLINRLDNRWRNSFILFGLACGAFFTGIIGALGARFVWDIAHTTSTSVDLEVPMWIVYLAIPLGSFLMCFRFLQVAVHYARTGELPHHDHGHVDGVDDDAAASAIAASPLTPKER